MIRLFWRILGLIGLAALMGCAAAPQPLTIDAARRTAVSAGCWPGEAPTLLPVTVTPWGGFAATPDPLLPSPTVLPSSTPYPRCTPLPGAPTLRPYPTPAPVRASYPTRIAFRDAESQGAAAMLHLPETVLAVDIAAHPSANWPAIVAVAAPLTTRDDPRPFVRIFDAGAGRWGAAHSLGTGDSRMGRTRFRTAQIGITGDSAVHVVWGVTVAPRLGLVASSSHDAGVSWSDPQPIARDTYGALDLAAAPDGRLAVLSVSEAAQQPLIIRRTATGQWQPPEYLPIPAWYGSAGVVAILGDGDAAHMVVAISGGGNGSADNTLFLLSRPFMGGAWNVERRAAPSPDGRPADLLTHLRAVPVGADRLLVTFAMAGRAAVYAVSARAGGREWGTVELVARGDHGGAPFAAPVYDVRSDRALVLWTCCGDASFVSAESTHYARWSDPGGSWQPVAIGTGAPVITGAVAAADTTGAQAPNSRVIWLAWVEDVHQVVVRALDLGRIPPPDQLPAVQP